MSEYEENLEYCLNYTGRVGSIWAVELFLPERGTILSYFVSFFSQLTEKSNLEDDVCDYLAISFRVR